MSRLLTNKYVLIGLGIVAIIGLIFISYNATQNSVPPTPTPVPVTFQPKTATLPPPVKDHPVSGQIIVKFKPQYTDAQINAHLQQYNASILNKIEGINQTVVKVPAGQEQAIMQKLLDDGYAENAQRDYTTHAFFVPNDPGFSLQYGLNNIGQAILGKNGTAKADIHVEQAWDVTQGNGVKVAILDTGINLNHPDLAGKVVLQKSFVSNTVEDGNGHGTHVAGIITADTNNGIGVAGTCPGCQLLIGKVLDDSGSGTTSNATAGITWAADNGAKVINMSLGTTDPNTEPLYAQAVNYAMSKGAVVVAAAGNDGNSTPNYPAAVPGVISVAATTNNDTKASYSNFGSYVEIAAPGDNILSTGPTHSFQLQPMGYNFSSPYMYLSGTSMATPYVSGVAALVASTQYGTTPQALTTRLYSTADRIPGSGTLWQSGRVDAAQAVGPAPTATTAPQPTAITPTLVCVGGNGTPPCATIPPSGPTIVPNNPTVAITGPATGGGTNPGTPINGTPAPTTAITPSPLGTNPNISCPKISAIFYNLNTSSQTQNVSTMDHDHDKKHKKGSGNGNANGGLSQFIQFLLQLLQLLLQLITQCQPAPSTGTPLPTIAPGTPITVVPTVSAAPTVNLVSPAAPTISTAPTVNLVSPTTGAGGGGNASNTPPVTRLGTWIGGAENNGNFATVPGQKPDVANTYVGWEQSWPSGFVNGAAAAGATPFIELEPWNDANGNGTPQFSDIVAGKYDSWLTSIGNSAKSFGKPVIFTFAHEFNIGGQYPWSISPPNGSSCGSSPCTPAQWIQAWDHVESVVNAAAGGKNVFWMWAPNVDSGGQNTNPVSWWPGSNEVQMVGVDGYPNLINPSGGTFQSGFGQTFSEIHSVTKLPIFISETDLAPLGSGGFESIPNFIKDLFADGGDGILEFEEGGPYMSSSQWSQLDAALAAYPN